MGSTRTPAHSGEGCQAKGKQKAGRRISPASTPCRAEPHSVPFPSHTGAQDKRFLLKYITELQRAHEDGCVPWTGQMAGGWRKKKKQQFHKSSSEKTSFRCEGALLTAVFASCGASSSWVCTAGHPVCASATEPMGFPAGMEASPSHHTLRYCFSFSCHLSSLPDSQHLYLIARLRVALEGENENQSSSGVHGLSANTPCRSACCCMPAELIKQASFLPSLFTSSPSDSVFKGKAFYFFPSV